MTHYLVLGYRIGKDRAHITHQQSHSSIFEAKKDFDKLPKHLSRWVIDEDSGDSVLVAAPEITVH